MAEIRALGELAAGFQVVSAEPTGDARKPWVKPQITSCELDETEFSPHGPFVDNSLFS